MAGFNIGGFAGQGRTPSNTLETSRRHRYILQLLRPMTNALLIVSHKCGRPTTEITRVVVHHGQDEIYMPGKNRWLPIEISFYETHNAANSDNTADEIYRWWSQSVLAINQSKIASNFKRNGTLHLLDGASRPVWEYRLLGTWPSKVSPDTLDYSDIAICEITVTLELDKCEEIAKSSRPSLLRGVAL